MYSGAAYTMNRLCGCWGTPRSTMNVNVYIRTLHLAYLRNSTRNMMSRITRITTTIAPTIPPTAAAIGVEPEAVAGGNSKIVS